MKRIAAAFAIVLASASMALAQTVPSMNVQFSMMELLTLGAGVGASIAGANLVFHWIFGGSGGNTVTCECEGAAERTHKYRLLIDRPESADADLPDQLGRTIEIPYMLEDGVKITLDTEDVTSVTVSSIERYIVEDDDAFIEVTLRLGDPDDYERLRDDPDWEEVELENA